MHQQQMKLLQQILKYSKAAIIGFEAFFNALKENEKTDTETQE